MRSLGPIEDRLVVALRYDILNGSRDERAILASQIDEAGLGQQMRITTKDFEDFFDDEVAK